MRRLDESRRVIEHERRITDLERNRPGSSGAFRLVWGALFNDAGIIDAGSGDWTAEWNDADLSSPGLNLYTIRFSTPFSGDDPVVLLTGNNNNPPGADGGYTVTLLRRANDHIVVVTYNVDDPDAFSNQDGGFDFAIIGAA